MEQETSKKQEQCPCKALHVIIASISEYILYLIYFILFSHICGRNLTYYYVISYYVEFQTFLTTSDLIFFLRP